MQAVQCKCSFDVTVVVTINYVLPPLVLTPLLRKPNLLTLAKRAKKNIVDQYRIRHIIRRKIEGAAPCQNTTSERQFIPPLSAEEAAMALNKLKLHQPRLVTFKLELALGGLGHCFSSCSYLFVAWVVDCWILDGECWMDGGPLFFLYPFSTLMDAGGKSRGSVGEGITKQGVRTADYFVSGVCRHGGGRGDRAGGPISLLRILLSCKKPQRLYPRRYWGGKDIVNYPEGKRLQGSNAPGLSPGLYSPWFCLSLSISFFALLAAGGYFPWLRHLSSVSQSGV